MDQLCGWTIYTKSTGSYQCANQPVGICKVPRYRSAEAAKQGTSVFTTYAFTKGKAFGKREQWLGDDANGLYLLVLYMNHYSSDCCQSGPKA